MTSHFERKTYTREEMNVMIAEQLGLCIDPICKEIGQVVEGLQKRIVELESATNAIIEEMRKRKNERVFN